MLLICTAGCAAERHPIPPNAEHSEAAVVALLQAVASEWSWHDNGRVRSVSLVGDAISDDHVLALHDLTELEELQLLGAITDDMLKEVAALPKLSALDVQFTAITDEGLRYLSRAPTLTLVVVTGTSITDEGLSHLADLRTLKSVFAEKTSISETGLMRFHDRRPDCRIQHDKGVVAAEPSDEREPG